MAAEVEAAIDAPQLTRMGAAAVLLAALAAAAWFWPATAPAPSDAGPAIVAAPGGPGTDAVTVHVSGLVAQPGLVEVADGARIADAIAAAGGLLPAADPTVLNLAALVRDGEQIRVPAAGEFGDPAVPGAPDDGQVRINSADANALQQLPGVGPVLAQRIVAHRESEGPFTTVEDLLDVPGIGEGKLSALRDLVAVP